MMNYYTGNVDYVFIKLIQLIIAESKEQFLNSDDEYFPLWSLDLASLLRLDVFCTDSCHRIRFMPAAKEKYFCSIW